MQRCKNDCLKLRVLSLFCAFVFLLSSFMTGTYAWQSEQKVMNNVYGTGDVMVPVELVKLEKTADGIETEKAIADTVFYLYRENGTQIGGRYVTDENGKISLLLNIGRYYFEEASPGIGYTYDTDINGNFVTRYYFTVTEQAKTITVKAYNKRLEGDLLIRKTIENTDGAPLSDLQLKTDFTFTVTFSDGGTYAYRIENGEEQLLVSGGTLKLYSGQTAVFENLPFGVLYDVVETPVDGYTVVSTGHRGNITETQSVADFINRCDQNQTGTLTVSKDVQGENADLTKEFNFVVTLGDVAEEITLRHGETKEYVGIPFGTQYTVTEEDVYGDGYHSTVKTYTGQILDTADVKLPFVNVYAPMPEGKFGSLTVSKQVIGENADPDKDFTFSVVFEGDNAPEGQVFILKAEETKIFENIPYGVTYTVKEIDSAGYDAVMNSANGIIVGDYIANVVFTNKVPDVSKETVKMTVQKFLGGEFLESDKERIFNLTLTVNGQTTEFTLKANEIKEFDIPWGAVYEVSEENYIKDGFKQSIVNGSGTAIGERIEVGITNTYVGDPCIEINGEKTWDLNGHEGVVLPKSITIRLKNGERLEEERIIEPDINNQWKYSFIVPKYNSDGSLAVYTLEEDEIQNFRARYDGYNIKNIYVKHIDVDPPIITKIVNGNNAPTSNFEFIFTGKYGTPMPEGSVGCQKSLTITDSGELEIGSIRYDKAGTYVYTVHEKNGGVEGWIYDTALYTVTVIVTERDYVLTAERTIKKNGVTTDSIVFTNTYSPAGEGTVIISGVKTWIHGTNPDKMRPDSIIVELYADGELAMQSLVTAEDNWQYSFEMPKYSANGDEIVYTIDEADVKDYKKQINGYDLINTYVGSSDGPGSPPTGDNTNLGFWLTMMILSLVGLISTAIYGKRNRDIPKYSKMSKT